MIYVPQAVINVELEEFVLLGALVIVTGLAWVTIRRLRLSIEDGRRQIKEQHELNAKLQRVVDKVLKIDADGKIDND